MVFGNRFVGDEMKENFLEMEHKHRPLGFISATIYVAFLDIWVG